MRASWVLLLFLGACSGSVSGRDETCLVDCEASDDETDTDVATDDGPSATGADTDESPSTPDSDATDSDVQDSDPVAVVSVVWDGDVHGGGAGWSAPSSNPVTQQSTQSRSGAALQWTVGNTNYWNEWGWNWRAWATPGTDVSAATDFRFAMKLVGASPPDDMVITLRSSITSKYAHQPPAEGELRGVSLRLYAPSFADGAWHDVTIPMADILAKDDADDFAEVFEVFIGAGAQNYVLYLDDLSFVSE